MKSMGSNGCRIIIGLGSMSDYLNVSKPTISTYIKMGMPGNLIGNRWHFHLDLVDHWFKKQCFVKYNGEKDPEELEKEV
jgi:hypothetical protein